MPLSSDKGRENKSSSTRKSFGQGNGRVGSKGQVKELNYVPSSGPKVKLVTESRQRGRDKGPRRAEDK